MKYTHNGGVAQGLSKTSIIALAVGFALTLVLSVFSIVSAVAYTFPSTNDDNRSSGLPHVNFVENDIGEVTLEFVNDTNSLSFFEYRADGEIKTSGTSHPVVIGDFIYSGVCVDGRTAPACGDGNPEVRTLPADEFVEVRLALGGERDWDFDWTRFDVLTPPETPTNLHRVVPGTGEVLACGVVTQRQTLYPTWDANSESDFSHYEYTSYNADGHIGLNGHVLATNQFVHSWTPPVDGTNGFKVRAVDNDGNYSEWSTVCEVTYDSVAPSAPEIIFPSNEQSFTSQPILNDWTDSTDDNGIDKYEIEYVYDDGHTFAGGPYRETVSSQRNHTPGISEQGGVEIRVRAYDNAGNVSDWSNTVHYYYDNEAPIVSIDSPLDGAVLSGLVDIVGDVTDNADLSHYNLSLYPSTTDLSDGGTHSGDRLNDVNWCTTPTGGTVNLSASIVDTLLCDDWDTTYLTDGDYQIRLAARDASGLRDLSDPFNAGTSSVHVIDITIDNTGELLGAVTDGNEDDGREVLGDNTENGEVLDSHTLSETGDPAILATLISLTAITLALGATRFSRR